MKLTGAGLRGSARTKRHTRSGCFAAAAAVAAWALLAPSSRAAAPVAPPAGANFATVAAATGVLQHTDASTGLTPTSEPVYGSLPDAYSRFGTGASYARSSTYYPGATVLGLGGLISTAGGPGGLPGYPFTAIAPSNGQPDASIPAPTPIGGPGQPASAQSATGIAHADADSASADAVISSFNAPGAGPSNGHPPATSVVHIGSAEAHTSEAFDPTGKLVSSARAHVSGIDIAGGLHFSSVTTTSSTTVDQAGKRQRADNVTVSGGTFNGTPVTVGSDGVSVAGSGQGKPALDVLNNALGQSLKAAGIRVHLVGVGNPSAPLNPRGCSAGEADGLEISAQVDASGIPVAGNLYYTDILLGAACSSATFAGISPPPDTTGGDTGGATITPAPLDTTPPPASPGDASSALSSGPNAPTSPVASPRRPTATPSTSTRRTRRTPGLEAELATATAAGRLRALYLAMGLVALGLVIGARSFIPARLPGSP